MNTKTHRPTIDTVAVAAALVGFIACNSGATSASPNPTTQTQTEQQCIQGWWSNAGGACLCPTQPECSAGDCVAYNVTGLIANKYYDGSISVSAKAKTMSTVGTIDVGSYMLSGTSLAITRPSIPSYSPQVSCTSGSLTIGGEALGPVDPNLAGALSTAMQGGQTTWKAAPLP